MKVYGHMSIVLVIVVLTLYGCTGTKEVLRKEGTLSVHGESAVDEVRWWSMPDVTDDMGFVGLREALEQSLAYYTRVGGEHTLRFGKDVIKVADVMNSMELFLSLTDTMPSAKDLGKALRSSFRVYRGGGGKEVLFTGYYEPVLRGSRHKSVKYWVPIYAVPKDVVRVDLGVFRSELKGIQIVGRVEKDRLVPYYTRHEIDRLGLLEGQGLEIAWVADPIEAFFLHIQGSGRILLQEGGEMAVHYAASNGRPYRSIGTLLIDTGKVPRTNATVPGLIEYLKANPAGRDAILDYNDRYVFFEEVELGPIGNLDIRLTAGRSLATDQRVYPPGALVYVETEIPVVDAGGRILDWRPIGRFMVNQDTGCALEGAGRADIYWGTGEEAGRNAGAMKRKGRLYFIAPITEEHGAREGLFSGRHG